MGWQQPNGTGGGESLAWEHRDTHNASYRMTYGNGAVNPDLRAELDLMNSNVGLTTPPSRHPTPLQVKLMFESAYPSIGDAMGPGANLCLVDGTRRPCGEVGLMRQNQQVNECRYNNCGPRVTYNHERQREELTPQTINAKTGAYGYWTSQLKHSETGVNGKMGKPESFWLRVFVSAQAAPQKTGILDLEKLRNNVEELLGDADCAGYVKALIKQAEENTRNNPAEFKAAPIPYNPAEFTNPLDRFDEFKFTIGKTGFGGTVSGSLREGDATVHLNDLWNVPIWKGQPAVEVERALALTALHEMIHLAGKNGSLGYGDWEMAVATSYLPDAPLGSVAWDPKRDGSFSKYWDKELEIHCNFNKK